MFKFIFKIIVYFWFFLSVLYLSWVWNAEQKKHAPIKEPVSASKNRANDSLKCQYDPCPDDNPPIPEEGERAVKLNDQWYLVPHIYSMGYSNFSFFWPSKTPALAGANGEEFPEKGKPYHNHAVEIFLLREARYPGDYTSFYQGLLAVEKSGENIEKIKIKPNLEVWNVFSRDGKGYERWFVASGLNGDDDNHSSAVRCYRFRTMECTGGWIWKENISIFIHFNGIHGPDWPEIYMEIQNLLNKIKKA